MEPTRFYCRNVHFIKGKAGGRSPAMDKLELTKRILFNHTPQNISPSSFVDSWRNDATKTLRCFKYDDQISRH